MTTYSLVDGLTGQVNWNDPSSWVGGIVPGGAEAGTVVLDSSTASVNGALEVVASTAVVGDLDVGYGVDLSEFQASVTVFGTTSIAGEITGASPASLLSAIDIATTGSLTLAGSGTLAGPINNDGVIDDPFGTLSIARAVTGGGTIELGGFFTEGPSGISVPIAASLDLVGPCANTIELDIPASTVTLLDPAGFTGVISGFSGPVAISTPNDPTGAGRTAPGDQIVLAGVPATSLVAETLSATPGGEVLALTEADGTTLALRLAGQYGLADFAFAATPDGTGTIITDTVVDTTPCFAAGTRLATPSGPVAVESLRPGDQLLLAGGGQAPVRWTGHRRQRDADLVRIGAGALGRNAPMRDLAVSTDHALFVDGVLVPAGLLVDGDAIRLERRDEVAFWHVELDRHAVLLAEGAAAESYLDTGNRRRFSNCALGYDPVHDAAGSEPCAELVLAGERLERVRSVLRERNAVAV